MKKTLSFILTLALLACLLLPLSALADGESFELYFTFDKEFYEVGDTVTVQLHLDRTDSDADYTMYYFEGGVIFDKVYLEYTDSSANANNAEGMRVTPSATYYNMTRNTVGVRYHGLTSPLARSAKLVLAELQFTALQKIRSATLYHTESAVSVVANTTASLTTTNGAYVIGDPNAPTFAVSFAPGADGVTGKAPAAVEEKAEGDAFVLPACSWERQGHTFAGWSDGAAKYDPGAQYAMPAADVVFTAQWTKDPVKRNISFTAGDLAAGQAVSGQPPEARQLFPGETLSLPTQNTMTLAGYSFEGWSLGDKTYQPGDVYAVPDGDSTFAALWKSIDTGGLTGGGGKVTGGGDPEAPWVNPYSDVAESDWFYDSVKAVTQAGLMEGDGGQFSPNANMNRAMLVTVLYRIAGEPAVTAANPFSDVPDGQWYTEAVVWASGKGLVEGYVIPTAETKGVFAPLDPLTRQQMVTLLWRWKGSPAPAGSVDPSAAFKDWASVADWARDAMAWAAENGYIEGMSDGSVLPGGIANRAQCAALLTRLLP